MTGTQRSAATFPAGTASIADRVDGRIVELLDDETRRWSAIDAKLEAPLASLRQFIVRGGKRLRPVFCACAFVGAGGDPDDPALVDGAAALELVHTFALVHDDVMDGSRLRRGHEAVHEHFDQAHAREGLRGESRRFGEGMAILVGDLAVVYADTLMRAAPPDARAVFDELRIELCIGQSLDLIATVGTDGDEALAHRIATYKSGKYTVERPLHLGAALAGQLRELAAPLSAIGLPMGRAFQLRDDLLGVFGDEEIIGKSVGDDLREGKLTPLLAVALNRAHEDERVVLDRVGRGDLDDGLIKELQDTLVTTGARATIEAEIDDLVAEAQQAIDAAPLRAVAQGWLRQLATYVGWRDR